MASSSGLKTQIRLHLARADCSGLSETFTSDNLADWTAYDIQGPPCMLTFKEHELTLVTALVVWHHLPVIMKSRLYPHDQGDGGVPTAASAPGVPSSSGAKEGVSAVPTDVEPTSAPVAVQRQKGLGGAPLPKRPKGQILISGTLIVLLGVAAYVVWNGFLRYGAYGTVTGRLVEVPPPWSGNVKAFYVQDGDQVRCGDILAVLDSPEISASIDRLTDDMRVAQAELDAQVATLALVAQNKDDRKQEALADYYETMGELLAEKSTLDYLRSKLSRNERLAGRRIISAEEADSLRFSTAGQSAKVEQLEQAVAELKKRVQAVQRPTEQTKRLKPKLAHIEHIQADIRRLREKLRAGTVRAPVGGRIVRVLRFVGEHIEPTEPIVQILNEGSLELVVFVSQAKSDRFAVGQTMSVLVEPLNEPLDCRVNRIGDGYVEPPKHIENRYADGEKLLPIYLTPVNDLPPGVRLRLDSEVRVPTTWTSVLGLPL